MIEWPFCSIHQVPMQLVCVGGVWQYVCTECQKTPLTYSAATEVTHWMPLPEPPEENEDD